jgi:EAL domain-containing protein (putative c-di-GMP-specific phosphodiesterase class I)
MGIGLSLDDFGTGYSSLAYLRRFPLNTVKIERSFVSDLGTSADAAAIATAIIAMAHALGSRWSRKAWKRASRRRC